MFPISPVLVGMILFMMLVIGFSMGALSGLLVLWFRKANRRGWWIDGLLGMIGYVVVFAIVLYFAAMIRSAGLLVNPVLYAFLAALIAPALREWLRTRSRLNQ